MVLCRSIESDESYALCSYEVCELDSSWPSQIPLLTHADSMLTSCS